MAHDSFGCAGFPLDLDRIRNFVQIDPNINLARIMVPSFELDGSFIDPIQMRNEFEGKNAAPVPKPSEFAIIRAAYIQAAAEARPLCGHEKEDRS